MVDALQQIKITSFFGR